MSTKSTTRAMLGLGLLMMSSLILPRDAVGQEAAVPGERSTTIAAHPPERALRDQVEIQLGVSSFATNATAASAANHLTVQRVMQAVSQSGVQLDALESGRVVLVPAYARPDPVPLRGVREDPRIVGYRAIGEVIVRTRDTLHLGLLLDAATGAGANEVVRVEAN